MAKGKQKSRSRSQKVVVAIDDQPAPVSPTIRSRLRPRWIATAAASTTISTTDIGNIYCIAATAVAGYQLFNSSFRIRRISVWGAPSSTGAATTVSVDYSGTQAGALGSSVKHSDTRVGTAVGPVIHSRPPRGSQAAQWQSSSGALALCTINVTAGAVVEVEADFCAAEGGGSIGPLAVALVGATVGAIYQRSIDGVAVATANYVSQGFAQV